MSSHPSEPPRASHVDADTARARQRTLLAERIGALLARHWLASRASQALPVEELSGPPPAQL
jgi:hypothetical protein